MNRLINDISGNNPRRLTRTTLALGAFLAILMAAAPAVHAQDGPVIDVWYGLSQQFGDPGEPQIWCDIQGNVSDPDGVSSLSYTLNGGASVDLTIGTDGRRLITPGDFIVDLLVADLLVGANSVVITAVDGLSNVNTETVTLTYSAGNSWPTNYATDWGSLTTDGNPLTPDPAILEQAHVVDGKWTVVGDSIRTIEPGYDRLIGIGELGWGDYEVTVPVTIHNILDVGEFGVGLIFRWNGHTNDPDYCDQPLCGWKPLGDIGWLKNGRLNLWDHDINSSMTVNLDTVYWLKMRVETDAGGAQYSLKAWEDGQAEPAWMITDTKPANSPMAGSLLLVAHEAEASFGNVTIVDVTGPNVAPVANDFTVNAKFDGISLLSVHLNDTDSDGVINPASVSIVAPPADGTATVDPVTGIVEYLHGGGPNPTDTFTYTVEDNDGATSNVATVNLTIVPNQLPTANDDSAGVKVAESVDIDVAANDTDSDGTIDRTTVSIEDNPLHGTILAVHPTTGVITYAQDLGAAAADSFTYTVDDNDGATSNIATVVITITPNVAPTANDDDAFVAFNSTVMIDVTANDTDSDGVIDPTTVAIVDPPFNGTPSIDPVSGVVTYIHTALTAEPDSFTYTVQDDTGDLSNPAMVRINVGPEPPEDFFSDDFNSCGLDPMWTFIDPLGDAPDPVIVGAFSGDAQVAISVPGGISHEPYNGVINAPYILQASQDKDFTVEVKFSSTLPDTSYGEQGIIVLQDNQTWLRFDFNSTETAIRAFGTTDGNTPTIFDGGVGIPGDQPLYLRVQRTGDLWDMYYSSDGSAWTLAGSLTYNLTVTGVGLFAGNHSPNGTSAPPFTTFVDYFSNTVDAVVEPDDQDLNSIYITTSGLGSVAKSPDQAVYTCGDPVQLTATPDVDWVFTGWSGDLSGTDNPATITMDRPRHVTANFAPTSGTVIVANTSGVPGISTGLPCATGVPVEILRDSGTDIRGFTVTFGLTNLDLCDGILSITEGDYLSSISATSFNPIDNLDGTYDVDIAILGEPCGATALTGTLFTLDVTNTIPDGTGTIDITNVELRDCLNAPIAAAAGGPADILIDTTAPTGVTNLAFSKVMLDNAPGNVTEVDISWTDSVDPDAATVSVYRKGFGGYPEYDDGGGSAPTLPVNPIAEGWELVNVVPAGAETTTDLATTRDYWYFCARAADALGNQSTAVMTTGVLNYLLGDVSDGGDPILDGDNKVWTDDLTLLGAHYGTSDGQPLYLNNLDIGPSSDMSVDGLPTTDDMIEFEDLMLFGINYGTDAGASAQALASNDVPDPAPNNILALHLPDIPGVGETFQANLVLASDGRIQGIQMPLVWDPAVVEPVSIQGGQLLTDQGGNSLVLSASPGVVDVCLAGVRESGISGVGTIASVTFQVLAAGNTQLQIADVDARGQDNSSVPVTTTAATPVGDDGDLPTVSALHLNYPNPFNPMTTISFDLAVPGRVRIDIYSIDGRRIRTLVDSPYTAGRHSEVWNGRDQSGRAVASGTYLYTMEGPAIRQTRRMLLIK